jgi:ADP-ribose pyrophosphatase YjhB (NUDIX family)
VSQTRVLLVTGLLERDGALLLVASRYPNHAQPLWNLPGGRPAPGELLEATLQREFREETSLEITVGGLRYVAESYDLTTNTHFVSIAFDVLSQDVPTVTGKDAHVVDLAWVPRAQLAARIAVAVVREPLLAHLANPEQRYFGFADAGITIEFADLP